MKASDVMVSKVITTHPQASISEAAKLLIDNDVSALPVVDEEGGRARRRHKRGRYYAARGRSERTSAVRGGSKR